jgi:hypothetical protein
MYVEIGPYVDEGERQEVVRIDKYDTWSMDHTLALIVLPMLKQLKEEKHGAPNVDPEDVPEELRMPKGWYEERYSKDGETDENFFKRWDWVMDQMIWSFTNLINDLDYLDYYDDAEDITYTELEWTGVGPAQLLLFPDECGKTEEYEYYELVSQPKRGRFNKDKYMQHEERMQRGFTLFGKYYRNLWD